MSVNKLSFSLGQRVALSYEYVQPYRLLGQVVRVTPRSILVHIDGECRASRFFLHDGRWRSEFGRRVSIDDVPENTELMSSSDRHGTPVVNSKPGTAK